VSRDAMFNNYKVVFPTRPEHSTILTSGYGAMSADEIHPHNLLPQGQHVTGTRRYGIGTMIRRT